MPDLGYLTYVLGLSDRSQAHGLKTLMLILDEDNWFQVHGSRFKVQS